MFLRLQSRCLSLKKEYQILRIQLIILFTKIIKRLTNLQYIYFLAKILYPFFPVSLSFFFFSLFQITNEINRKLYHNNPVKLYKSRTRSSTFRFVNLTRDIEVMHNLNEQTTRVSCRSQSTSLFRSSALICSSIEPRFQRNVTLFETRTTGIITINYTLLIKPVLPLFFATSFFFFFSPPPYLSLSLSLRFSFFLLLPAFSPIQLFVHQRETKLHYNVP